MSTQIKWGFPNEAPTHQTSEPEYKSYRDRMGKLGLLQTSKPKAAPPVTTQVIDPIQQFDALVQGHIDQGLTRREAVNRAARCKPELHENYILAINNRPNPDQALAIKKQSAQDHFWLAVATEKSKGKSHRDACIFVKQNQPELFQAYLSAI